MISKFWKFATLYLVVGIFWGSFFTYKFEKGIEEGRYPQQSEHRALLNALDHFHAFIWPVSLPIGLYILVK